METVKQLYIENLHALRNEISSYKNEADIWKLSGDIKNPPGNLCLHICGNLNFYFGFALGNTGFQRNRDLEFTKKGVSRDELIHQIDKTKEVVSKVLDNLRIEDYGKAFPVDYMEVRTTIGYEVHRLLAHLAYHLGQINYHRRILE